MSTCQPSAHAIKDTAALLKQELDATATHVIRAPGRVNLIGEHTDYNDGFVLPCAIDFATEVAIAPRTDNRIRVVAADYDNQRDEFAADVRPQHSDKGWANYIRGVVDVFIQRFGPLPHGLDMVVSGNVPQGAGLSSSAALEVAVGKALQTAFGLNASLRDIALLGQQAENEFVGCRCGIMDQFISALGKDGHALLIDCRSLETETAAIPDELQVMIIDSKVQRGLVGSEYNTRREQCEAAAAHFGVKALRDVDLVQLQATMPSCAAAVCWQHNRPPVCSCPWGGKRVGSIGKAPLFRLKPNTPNPILVSFQPKISETASSNTPLTRY